MASTTVRYQMDKDQRQQHSSCWPDTGDIGDATAGENLFDEYVTFDPNDFLRDPQSPSAVLEATDDSVTNSSSNNDQDIFPILSASSFAEDAALFDFPSSVPEQNISLPAFLNGTDPVLAGESITDSELLRLEGISLKSPSKEDMTAPLSPSLLLQSSPTKRGRFVDSVCSTFRRATGRSRPPRTHRNAATLDLFGTEPGPQPQLPNGNYEYTTDPLDVKPEPIDNNGLPLSPPLTGKIPYSGGSSSYASNAPFVAGNIEDPFCDKIMAPHMGNDLIDTPLDTPALKDDFFFSSVVPNTIDPGTMQLRRPKQRNASSAEWPLDGIISDEHTREWSANNRASSSYHPDKNNALHSPNWWDEPSTPSSHAQQQPQQGRLFGNGNNAGPHHDAVSGFEHNQSMHHHQSELPYEYTSELSGLMIHMPQPRQPQAAVLTAGNAPEQLLTPAHHHASPASIHHMPQHRGRFTDQRQQQQHLRRPQPRAPSSGARHFSHGGGNMHHHQSLTSPCKQPTLHRSGSRSMLVHREESVSPSPGGHGHHHRPRRVTSSSGLSVRKQRSWSSRAPRTPNPSSSHHPTSRSHSSSFGGSPKGGGGGGGVDFVNFTPSDKNLLMTGVAPSGSSKTKARREKEAADRRRRISEAAVKAVQAAGGDVDGLVMDDFGF